MATATADRLHELLEASLEAWGAPGTVARDGEGGIVVEAAGQCLRIAAAAPDLPFRWQTTIDGRTRGYASVTGVLGAVRRTLDADYRPLRLRIAPLPAVTP